MQKTTIRIAALARAAIVLAMGLFGWVANATRAQDPRQETPANTVAAKPARSVPSRPEDLNVPNIKSEPAISNLSNPPLAVETKPSPVEPSLEPNQVSPRSSLEEIAASNDTSAGLTSAASAIADPEKAALAFVAENQKLAESQLKNLRDEESKLKARLLKVQAGIKRWELLVEAFKQSEGSIAVAVPKAPTSRVDGPIELDPVSPRSDQLGIPK